jgi:hypothetical protein
MTEEKKDLTDEEILKRVKERLKSKLPEEDLVRLPELDYFEDAGKIPLLNYMRKTAVAALADPEMIDPNKLRRIYGLLFETPAQTLEMMQLHENQLACDKRFTLMDHDFNDRLNTLEQTLTRKTEIIKWGLIAVAASAGLFGIVEWDVITGILRAFGIGI